ncbi:energy transducer TonB, partial [Neptunomonas sp. XY-337]|uniref:energy transducer TonB n=1 Tax=Neptunomonas sp. XY-337 TaxID=2561897 RepID=UPI00145B2A20
QLSGTAEQPINIEWSALRFAAPPVKPRYPRMARRRGVEGEVRVLITIGPGGRVKYAEIEQSSGSQALDQAAMKAVRQWRFTPHTRGFVRARAPITFSLTSP